MSRSIGKYGIRSVKKMYKWTRKKTKYSFKVIDKNIVFQNGHYKVELVLTSGEAIVKNFKTKKSADRFYSKTKIEC